VSQTNDKSLPEFARFMGLVLIKIRFNLRSESAKSTLSYSWWVLEPLLQMAVYYVIFGVLLARGTEDFVAFLLCGLVPWLWFSRSVSNSSLSIVQGRGIINQTYIPKAFFPLVVIGQDALKQLVVLVLLMVFLLLYGFTVSASWLWIVPILATQLLFIAAASLLVSFLVPFALDLVYLINTGLIMLMFGSGVFYSYEQLINPAYRELFLLNPMANIIVNYRMVLMEGRSPMILSLLTIAGLSILIIFVMHRVMRRYDNQLTRVVAN
jgi:lipopolysaccharide transport system permease protein